LVVGAITVFNPSHQLKKILLIVVPYIAFGWYWLTISGQDVTPLYVLRICNFVVSFRKDQPSRTLMIFGLMGMTAMLIGFSLLEQ
jgi:FHS family L-fucose permease-like MFS transporter